MNPMNFTRFAHLTTAELNALVEQLAARSRELYRAYKAAHRNGASVKRAFKAYERIEQEAFLAHSALYVRPDYTGRLFA